MRISFASFTEARNSAAVLNSPLNMSCKSFGRAAGVTMGAAPAGRVGIGALLLIGGGGVVSLGGGGGPFGAALRFSAASEMGGNEGAGDFFFSVVFILVSLKNAGGLSSASFLALDANFAPAESGTPPIPFVGISETLGDIIGAALTTSELLLPKG